MRCRSLLLVTCIAVSSVVAGGCAATFSSGRTGTEAANSREVTGRVASYTTAPRGEMDGVVLDTGNRVHFPPHTGEAMLPVVGKGKVIRVVGVLVDKPEGKVIEATSITDVDKGETVTVASVSRPREQPQPSGNVKPPSASQPTTTLTGAELKSKEGKVQGYTTAASGDMDGVLLDTGARVHFPAHVGKAVLPLVRQGATVRIIGWEVSGPEGVILEATKIIATPSGQAVDIADVPAPKPTNMTPGAVSPPGSPPLDSAAPPASRVR
jgi:hypothetical protein